MKLAIDIRHLSQKNLSGVGHYTLRLINELAKLSPETDFILFAAGSQKNLENFPRFTAKNIFLIKKNWPNKLINLLLLLKIRTLESWLPQKPDAWFFPNLNIVYTKLSYAITVHDLSFEILPDVFTQKQRIWHRVTKANKLVNEAKVIFAVSESTRHDLIERWQIEQEKITVTHLGVDAEFRPKKQPEDNNFLRVYKIDYQYFLTLSTIEPRKNLESVVEAYELWRAKTKRPIHLVITGAKGWKTKKIFTLIKNSKFSDEIHLIDYVPDKHRPALMRGALAFLFPSYWEGFGLPILEAMACGTPVMASFTSSLPEIVGQAGILVDPFMVSDLVNALEHLEDPTVSQKLTELGLQRANQFSWPQTASKTWQALQSLKSI